MELKINESDFENKISSYFHLKICGKKSFSIPSLVQINNKTTSVNTYFDYQLITKNILFREQNILS